MAAELSDIEVLLEGLDEFFGGIKLFRRELIVIVPPLLVEIAHHKNADSTRVGCAYMATLVKQVSAFKNITLGADHEVIAHIIILVVTHVEIFNLLGVFVAFVA